jgi:UDP-GlcNAc:undecaprenyl-phosphate GlcNAc-1-phosphate transferase
MVFVFGLWFIIFGLDNMYFTSLIATFILAIILTGLVRRLALRWRVIDKPTEERKIHAKPTPLLGGLAIFLSLFLVLGYYLFFTDKILSSQILVKNLVGVFLGGLLLMVGGFLDDKFKLAPRWQIVWPTLAAVVVIGSGVGINYITNPLGGTVDLNNWEKILFWWNGIPYKITLFADLFTFIWLMGMMYTTKFLDGLDGLVSGVSTIGAVIIFFVSLMAEVAQPETATLAIIFAGACAGFLLWNFNPAKIFLGEGGSLFIGFMLGVLSIIAGGKIATVLLIMGLPILDAFLVLLQRLATKRSLVLADTKHLHFRLLDAGLSQRQAVFSLYFVTLVFGSSTLVLRSEGKLLALGLLCILGLFWTVVLLKNYQNKRNSRPE